MSNKINDCYVSDHTKQQVTARYTNNNSTCTILCGQWIAVAHKWKLQATRVFIACDKYHGWLYVSLDSLAHR